MRERLIQYVDLLFAAAPDAEDIKQEILQNTLDRYDDLVSQGKSPEAAYRLAISGIGDISEILGQPQSEPTANPGSFRNMDPEFSEHGNVRKLRASAICMYIASAVPLFILSELGNATMGLCMTILLVAAATYLMILSRKPSNQDTDQTPKDPRKVKLDRIMTVISLVVYLTISILTQAWPITWLVFPIFGCIEGLINAIYDLKEACSHED